VRHLLLTGLLESVVHVGITLTGARLIKSWVGGFAIMVIEKLIWLEQALLSAFRRRSLLVWIILTHRLTHKGRLTLTPGTVHLMGVKTLELRIKGLAASSKSILGHSKF